MRNLPAGVCGDYEERTPFWAQKEKGVRVCDGEANLLFPTWQHIIYHVLQRL